jgi:glycosyltransferase involved in cell wall biosynthesis
MKSTKVSFVCISYNQESYIAQTLEGFVSQKTDFKFEVIIADDKSTDNTPKIIKEYAARYPDIIKPILRNKNLGPQRNFVDALQNTTGDYIALCEGDDFWTDTLKIQKQADFLDANSSYSIVFHPVRVFFENREEGDTIFPEISDTKLFTLNSLLKNNYIQTNSVMYRKIDYNKLSSEVMPFDWYLHLSHVKDGKIGFINEVMSAYRRHAGGIWWQTTLQSRDEIWKKHGSGYLVLYAELLKMYGHRAKSRRIIDESVENTVNILNRIDNLGKTNLIDDFVNKFPESVKLLFSSLSRTTYLNYELFERVKESQRLAEIKLRDATRKIGSVELEKEKILNSKAYRLGNKIAQIPRSIRRLSEK